VVKRVAFTLIELIFAIVIIGISVISLPLMVQTSSTGIEKNLVQEAIFAASTQLNQAIAANWDANSLEDGVNDESLARIIDDGTCANNPANANYRHKVGHILQPLHRRCLDSNTTGISGLGTGNNSVLEDFAGTQTLSNAGASGYKTTYTTAITVTRNANFNGANTNIKMIQANISDASGLITSLRTYSANIGEPDYYKREY